MPPPRPPNALGGASWTPVARVQAAGGLTSAFSAGGPDYLGQLSGIEAPGSGGGTQIATASSAAGTSPTTPQTASGSGGSGAGGIGLANTFFGAFGALLLLTIPRLFRRIAVLREAEVPPPFVLLLDHPG